MDGGVISIIVPCYNIEKYIEKTVFSILSQTYEHLEVILVDDGSTDLTSVIIDRLAEENDRIFAYHKTNGGVNSARLYGIDQAHGDWIGFVDGDDLLKPEMYRVLMNNAVRYNADISHCGYEMVFPNHIDSYYGTGRMLIQNNFEGQRDLLSGNFVEPGLWNKLYRRELVISSKKECSENQNIRIMEDLLWNYFFFKRASRSVYSDECLYQYVLRKGSAATSQVNRYKMLDPLYVFQLIARDTADEALRTIAREREIARLIDLAVMPIEDSPKWVARSALKAQRILERNRERILHSKYSLRLRLKVLLASVSPCLYAYIHAIYSKFRGTDHTYDIE